jgi:saccharopine dehydrogenase-like NADP-dependent oxidoreductase
MQTLFDLGFGSLDPIQFGSAVFTEREIFSQLLLKKLPSAGPDVVLVRAEIVGKSGVLTRRTYEMIDFGNETDNISAMMRGTAYPTSVIAQMIQRKEIHQRGVFTPEQVVPLEPLLAELRRRGMDIVRSEGPATESTT